MVLVVLPATVSLTLDISCIESPLSSPRFQVARSPPLSLQKVVLVGAEWVGLDCPEIY